MRLMIILKASANSEAEMLPDPALFAAMASSHEELAKAGALLDAAGLRASRHGWRFDYSASGKTQVDGPFAASGELIAGYTLIQVSSRAEALEWSKGFPNPAVRGLDAQIELRQLYELEDFELAEDTAQRFRNIDTG